MVIGVGVVGVEVDGCGGGVGVGVKTGVVRRLRVVFLVVGRRG